MTDQEAFDAMCRHLLKMRRQTRDPATGACMYRGPRGTRCAVGALIPDEQYRSRFEGGYNLRRLTEEVRALNEVNYELLQSVQALHDSEIYWGRKGLLAHAKTRLREIAGIYNLFPAVLDSPR
jgi:hypothetical protein